MSRNGAILAVVSILVVASIGTGFALSYYSITTSRDNTIIYDGVTLDIKDNDNHSLSTSIPLAGPTTYLVEDGLTQITGGCNFSYNLVVNCPSPDESNPSKIYLQCWINLANNQSWAVIDSVTIKIDDNGTIYTVDLVKKGLQSSDDPYTVSVPSAPLELKSGTYPFTVSIQYKDIQLDLEGEKGDFLNMSGSTISFSASLDNPADMPVPNVNNPWSSS